MKRLLTVLALLLCVGAQAAIFQNPFTTNSPTLTSSRLLFMSATGVPATSGSSLMVYNSISNPLDKTGTGLMMFQTAPIIDAPAISTSIALTFLKTNLLSTDANGLVTTTKFGSGITWDPATQTISATGGGDAIWTNVSGTIQPILMPARIVLSVDDNFFAGVDAGNLAIGDNNIAIGNAALDVNANSDNIALGKNALGNSTNGFLNIAIGENALPNLEDAFRNVALGSGAIGSTLVAGNDNVLIGYDADVFDGMSFTVNIGRQAESRGDYGIAIGHTALANDVEAVAIGHGAIATAANDFMLGATNHNVKVPGTFTLQNNGAGDGKVLTSDANGLATWQSGGTTATNIVALTQTGTNAAQMDFALVARGGVFKLSLTNNAHFGVPANVNNTDFKKCWLLVQQPATGTCLLSFTNTVFNWPQGVAPVIDTNAGAVTAFEFVTDVFTNGLVHGWMSLESRMVPR